MRKKISNWKLLVEQKWLLLILLWILKRYLQKSEQGKKFFNPSSEWYGALRTEETLLFQVGRVLESRANIIKRKLKRGMQ